MSSLPKDSDKDGICSDSYSSSFDTESGIPAIRVALSVRRRLEKIDPDAVLAVKKVTVDAVVVVDFLFA